MFASVLLGISFQTDSVAVIPKPAKMEFRTGTFHLGAGPYTIHTNRGAKADAALVAQELYGDYARYHGYGDSRTSGRITFMLDQRADTGDEGYVLDVTPTAVFAKAKNSAGLFYAGQTLRQ